MNYKRRFIAPTLALIFLLNCGGSSFATQLRVILATSGPLLNSLNLGDKKAAVVADFSDLARGAADLSDDLKACSDKPCKLDAVSRYQVKFWDVLRRGHFKLNPKLENIESILGGIIESAKLYYGAIPKGQPRTADSGPVPAPNAAKDLDDGLKRLKAAMQVQ